MKFVCILSSMLSLAIAHCFRLMEAGRDVVAISYDAARHVAIDFVMIPFRQVYAATVQRLDRFSLIAFQLIGRLKPEYRDSCDTHGLSLAT